MKGQGKIKYWFTRNGVHVPVYEKYTTRKGVEPENPRAKFKKGTKKEFFNTEESIRKTPEKKEFKLKNEVWHEDKEGWSVGLTSAGDIYVGSSQLDSQFYKDTPENRERAVAEWKANSFAKEISLPTKSNIEKIHNTGLAKLVAKGNTIIQSDSTKSPDVNKSTDSHYVTALVKSKAGKYTIRGADFSAIEGKDYRQRSNFNITKQLRGQGEDMAKLEYEDYLKELRGILKRS